MRELEEPAREQLCLTEILHALSDPTRLAVVEQLDRGGEQSCGCLDVNVAKSTLSQHLRVLREAGVTHTRPDGNQRWLSVRRPELDAQFPGLLDAVLGRRTASTVASTAVSTAASGAVSTAASGASSGAGGAAAER